MLLKAHEMGLGTLWIANTCFEYEELAAYLGTTAEIISAIAIGYANEMPAERSRKELKNII